VQRALELLIVARFTGEHVVAVAIAHRQRIATLLIAQQEPALEVHRPDVVGLRRLRQSVVARHKSAGSPSPPDAQTVAAQDLGDRAARWRALDRVLHLQYDLQLFRSPGAMLPALRQDQRLHGLVRLLRGMVRAMAARLQPRQTQRRVARQMLVAGFTSDPELLAQVGHTEAPALREHYESVDLFHGS
jgi:hypothetical protein